MDDIIEIGEGEHLDIELELDFLKENERLAQKNEDYLNKKGIKTIDVMGSVGSGKTSLIENLIKILKGRYRIGVIAGDLTTTIDRDRLKKLGVDTVQVNTGKECHLDARVISKALQNLGDIDLLFIENVGNLICPIDFPLGAKTRMVVISVTEGPYTPLKHPYIFMGSNLAVINKMDLSPAVEIDVDAIEEDIKRVKPGIDILRTSCKFGQGIEEVVGSLGL